MAGLCCATVILCLISRVAAFSVATPVDAAHVRAVADELDAVLGRAEAREQRRSAARLAAHNASGIVAPPNELVYGELGVAALAKLLDAVGVEQGDTFCDVGSGHGELVLAASLLHPTLRASRGVEIVQDLAKSASEHHAALLQRAALPAAPIELAHGDVYDKSSPAAGMLRDTTLAVCFATTWSASGKGRVLSELSTTLHRNLPEGARVVMVDARLSDEQFSWEGEMRLHCPDTAPFSTAHLYVQRS